MDLFQVKSKLDVLASYADAKIGLVTHGWITKIEKHGCFVKFYNGVQGFVSRLVSPFPTSEADQLGVVNQIRFLYKLVDNQ
jgi:predicted RNA-binding protein with RPS1 domain